MIDFNKRIQTRDGREVRILCTDGPVFGYPVVGIVGANIQTWTETGAFTRYPGESTLDLINTPQTFFVNVYMKSRLGNFTVIWDDKDLADEKAGSDRLACLEFKEGDGL